MPWPGGRPQAVADVDLSRPHLVGIGGLGMAPLATLLRGAGTTVTGSDASRGGHAAHHVDGRTVVVRSTAIEETNVEVSAAKVQGIPVVHRAQALDLVLADHNWTAVTGTHGKTTTTAMLAHILLRSGLDPTWAIGGSPIGMEAARWSIREAGVAEVDESDRSFLLTSPPIALVLNLDADHLENYNGRYGELVDAFEQWGRHLGEDTQLVLCGDDGGAMMLRHRLLGIGGSPHITTYGRTAAADMRIQRIESGRAGSVVALTSGVTFTFPVLGEEQALNAVGAITVAGLYGVPEADAAQALETFAGVERRLTHSTFDTGTTILTSYAHHPTAIRADLEAARQLADECRGRLILAFQPSGLHRVTTMYTEIALALAAADETVLLPLHTRYTGGEHDHLLPMIADRQRRVRAVARDLAEATDALLEAVKPGDVIVLMGTGDVADLAPALATATEAVETARLG
ncbi:UDP-N-acetylmuramate--alanine ligase [Actinocorallia herbida]|uniref:UDP-N-acetylmuramate--alanine ligase n=2 Tax=Actinocorallia herbida TaxID=58109 RepID=A0A3N1D3J6_9ACTN|nr:Mur ligase family protein [Actinocorallia herbida]ROO88091.1 UDP-N-acetylmuramate--alanine ligase [Actinocorallia herbida]